MIKKLFFMMMGLLFCNLFADSEGLEKGRLLYEQNQFAAAEQTFAEIEKPDASVWGNRALCHHMLGNQIDALGCLLNAQTDASWWQTHYALHLIEVFSASLKTNINFTWYQRVMHWCPLMVLLVQWLTLTSWYGLLWSVYRRNANKVRSGLLLIVFLSSAFLMLAAYLTQTRRMGLVREDTAAFVGPYEQFHKKGTVPALSLVRLYDEQGGWLKIWLDNGYAWIPKRVVVGQL